MSLLRDSGSPFPPTVIDEGGLVHLALTSTMNTHFRPALYYQPQPPPESSPWNNWTFTDIMGLSVITSFLQNPHLSNSIRLFILGTIIESGRRTYQWLFQRFKFKYGITAKFNEGDPAYEWILLFLTQKGVWSRSRDFTVTAKNSKRKWTIKPSSELDINADYVPTFGAPQLFRWNGYWVEVKRGNDLNPIEFPDEDAPVIYISIYTLNIAALSALVEEARQRYKDTSRPYVTVYTSDNLGLRNRGRLVWNIVKSKNRRPLNSIILLDGVIDSLVQDVTEFMNSEEWYIETGIPYRRGYLLHGPPGSRKTSTIYALASELGLEIYSVSLASDQVDDSYLQSAASSIPKHSILLIEDIDCAFPPRGDEGYHGSYPGYGIGANSYMFMGSPYPVPGAPRSRVTLSGLLNVLDGVGSEEGKLFFATTNYIDSLDPALLRPGRIDRKIEYFPASQAQAAALFTRFYARTKNPELITLAFDFGSQVPPNTFSIADLQGYLLSHKKEPESAVEGVTMWVEKEVRETREKKMRDEERRKRDQERRDGRWDVGYGGNRTSANFVQSADGMGMGMQGAGKPSIDMFGSLGSTIKGELAKVEIGGVDSIPGTRVDDEGKSDLPPS